MQGGFDPGGEGREVSLPLEARGKHPPVAAAPGLQPSQFVPELLSHLTLEEPYKMQIPGPLPNLRKCFFKAWASG